MSWNRPAPVLFAARGPDARRLRRPAPGQRRLTRWHFLSGKRALIVGLATERSIAYGIAAAMRREGAELAFTYQNDRLKDRVRGDGAELGSSLVLPMDVASDARDRPGVRGAAASAGTRSTSWCTRVAFAPREQLAGGYLDSVTREGFQIAHDISSYSLAALAKAARPMMLGRAGRDPHDDATSAPCARSRATT